MTAIARSKVNLYIVDVDTDASALVDGDKIIGEIKSYAKTGGESESESEAVFGGYVDKEVPQSQFELNFDIIPSLEDGNLWEDLAYVSQDVGGILTYVSGGQPSKKAVFIAAGDDTATPVGYGFNNCNVTVLDLEQNADDNQTKTLTLKFSPTNEDGIPNLISSSNSADTAYDGITKLPSWGDLTAV